MAKAEESQAKTAETLAGIERDDQDQIIEMVEKMNKAVRGV
jgi:DNA-binding MarR family transcriptional regulator